MSSGVTLMEALPAAVSLLREGGEISDGFLFFVL